MIRTPGLLLLASLVALTGCSIDEPLVTNGGILIDTSTSRVLSLKELHEQYIEMQVEDYSCGAASLATLARHYFDEDINEVAVLNTVKNLYSEEEYQVIANNGLSFLELGQVSEALGFQSVAVRLPTASLRKLKGPVLIYVETDEYKHFAVFKGLDSGYAYLADPSRGNIRLPMASFLNEWKGQALVLGKEGFGVPDNHNLAVSKSFVNDDGDLFQQFDSRLAPTQSELLGGTYAR